MGSFSGAPFVLGRTYPLSLKLVWKAIPPTQGPHRCGIRTKGNAERVPSGPTMTEMKTVGSRRPGEPAAASRLRGPVRAGGSIRRTSGNPR